MTDMVAELNDAMVPAIKQLEATSKQIETLAETLNNPEKDFQIAIAGIRELLDEVKKGESVAGILLRDKEAGADIRESLAKFSKASASFAAMMEEIEKERGPPECFCKTPRPSSRSRTRSPTSPRLPSQRTMLRYRSLRWPVRSRKRWGKPTRPSKGMAMSQLLWKRPRGNMRLPQKRFNVTGCCAALSVVMGILSP